MTDVQLPLGALRDAQPTPIAQLNPELPEQSALAVDGVVTIVWPFSIVTKSIAFILAERDPRLRRDNGQVRLRFHGAAAKAIADAKLGGGDEVRLGLGGVKWEKNETQTQLAGSTLEFQLEFTTKLLLTVRRAGEQEEDVSVINVDVPEADEEITNGVTNGTETVEEPPNTDLAIPLPPSPELSLPSKRRASTTLEPQEFNSPAFIKRARLSYGSLFEGGFDIFTEPPSKKRKAKKPTRFSLPANAWRYSSRSPSPEADGEPEQVSEDEVEEEIQQGQPETVDIPMATPPRPAMVDEGCQTVDTDFTPMNSVQVMAEARSALGFPQATPTPHPRSRPAEGDAAIHANPLNFGNHIQTSRQSFVDEFAQFSGPPPAHVDPALGFTFGAPPGSSLFAPRAEALPTSQAEDATIDRQDHAPRSDNYPTSFLDAHHSSSTTPHDHTGLHPDASGFDSQEMENSGLNFEPEAQFYPPYTEDEAHRAEDGWPTSQFTSTNPLQNPMEIISSSPSHDGASVGEQPSSSLGPPLRLSDLVGFQGVLEGRSVYDREEMPKASSEAEGGYQDGGDEPGDDYDLRNYDRAHDDDDDVESSEGSIEADGDDPDAQIINPEAYEGEEGADAEFGSPEYEQQAYGEYEGDEEGEYYSDEEGYDDEDEEELYDEEEGQGPSPPPFLKSPVFISLLSDSEDEMEDEVEPAHKPEPLLAQEPGPSTGPEPHLAEDSESSEASEDEVELAPVPPAVLEQAPEVPVAQPQSPAEGSEDSVETDREDEDLEEDLEEDFDEDLAEDTELPGQEPPSRSPSVDRMDVDGDQSPEPSTVPADSTLTKEVDRETPPRLTQEDDQSVSSSIERGDPASMELEESDRVNIESTDAVTKDAAATPQESNGDDKVEEEIQVRQVVHIEEVITISGDAMEVDNTEEVQAKDDSQVVGSVSDATNVTTAFAQETGGTTATTGSLGHEEAINVEAIDVVQVSAETTVTPGSVPSSSPASNVRDHQGTPQALEITVAAPETQGSWPGRSPDATLQETSRLASTEHRPSEEAQGTQFGNGEGIEQADGDQQLATNIPFSPPATQSFQSLISKDTEDALLTQVSNAGSTHELDEQLPTPYDTQQDAEMSAHRFLALQHDVQGDEDETGPDDQIMAEFLQHSPVRQDKLHHVKSAAAGTSPTQAEVTGFRGEEQPLQGEQGSEVLSTVKSLRSRGHRSTRSSDMTKASQSDPSLLLATLPAPPPHEEKVKDNSPPGNLRVTRSKTDHSDPSLQLAKASPNADEAERGRSTPPTMVRVTRSKADHSDPSFQLAKASPSSTRSTRRHKTPELPPRETRANSRGLPRGDTPDTISAVLQSPSVAGSAVEDESVGAVKLQLAKILRTNLSEYTSLKLLRNCLNKTVDIMAVAIATPAHPQRPKGGPRDYMLSLNLTDPSTAPTGAAVANLFRPHQATLPVVQAGDIVLLRRVQVVSMKNRGFGVRTGDASAWAVFEKADTEMLPQIKGPPVELNDEEVKYAEGLRRWWNLLDEKALEKIEKVSRKVSEAGKET